MKTSALSALLLILVSAQLAQADAAADKEARKVLEHWVGNWTGGVAGAVDTVAPHIATVPDHARVEWTLDDHFLHGTNMDKAGKAVGQWMMRHYPKTDKYQVWFFTAKGDVSLWNGTWDASKQTMNWETRDAESGVKGSGHTSFSGKEQKWAMSVTKDSKTQESSGALRRE